MRVVSDTDPAVAIKRAAKELWKDRGYGAVPIADICRAAGVSNGTFFYHYRSGTALALEVLADVVPLQMFINQLILHEGDTWDFIDVAFETLAQRVVVSESELFRAVIREQSGCDFVWTDPTSLPHLIRYITLRGQQRGDIRADLGIDELVDVATSTVVGIAIRWSSLDFDNPQGLHLAKERIKSLLDMVATPEALGRRAASATAEPGAETERPSAATAG
jgi:AcrR family transcriptional regulator